MSAFCLYSVACLFSVVFLLFLFCGYVFFLFLLVGYKNYLGKTITKKEITYVKFQTVREYYKKLNFNPKPNVVEVSEALTYIEGVEGVNIIINEIDQQVENAKVIVAGTSISFEEIQKKLKEFGATIHSIDEVAAGKRIVEEVMTPQDSSARM